MIRTTLAAGVVLTSASIAFGGGIERTTQSVGIIFETGNYVEFSFASVKPNISGVGAGAAPTPLTPTPGQASGGMAPGYSTFGVALKMPITDKIDAALILDQPFGADTAYPVATTYFARGTTARLDSTAITGVVKYRFNDNFSAFAGVRAQTLDAEAVVPFIPGGGYAVTGAKDAGFGYLVGAAYERPDIALRVALTYNSEITHKLGTTETSALGAGRTSTTEFETPQSVNLEFQTGIAKDTLLFGSIRWQEWSEFNISPADFTALTGAPLVSYEDDVYTYRLGLGRRLNDTWSVLGSMTYERSSQQFPSNLAPKDGIFSVGVGVTYTLDAMKVTAGVSHTWLDDVQTRISSATTTPAAVFEDNTATAFGLKIGFSF